MKKIIKRLAEIFLTCHFLISAATGVCGMILGGFDAKLRYADMFVPALMAFLCTLPTLLNIRSDKLTVKQLVLRKVLQILLVEAIVLSMVHFCFHGLNGVGSVVIVAVSVLVVFAGVSLADWARGCVEAEELNRCLDQFRKGM